MQNAPPFVVTLLPDENSSAFLNRLRKRYFPPTVNYLDAHLTLLHHLPSGEEKIKTDLERWRTELMPFPLQVSAVVSIGKGVAYKVESEALQGLHKRMQTEWKEWLKPQDRQKLWPHVTVQNKVSPAVAKETLAQLQASFVPFTAQALGFGLWWYEGGPWRLAEALWFD